MGHQILSTFQQEQLGAMAPFQESYVEMDLNARIETALIEQARNTAKSCTSLCMQRLRAQQLASNSVQPRDEAGLLMTPPRAAKLLRPVDSPAWTRGFYDERLQSDSLCEGGQLIPEKPAAGKQAKGDAGILQKAVAIHQDYANTMAKQRVRMKLEPGVEVTRRPNDQRWQSESDEPLDYYKILKLAVHIRDEGIHGPLVPRSEVPQYDFDESNDTITTRELGAMEMQATSAQLPTQPPPLPITRRVIDDDQQYSTASNNIPYEGLALGIQRNSADALTKSLEAQVEDLRRNDIIGD